MSAAMEARGAAPQGSYRQRASTEFRGVTRTSGTNSGVEKFDVQFVFCDSGQKRHPKIYGFSTASSAARAFDILTCKRALEKTRSVASVIGSSQALGTNHPTSDYTNEPLLSMLNTHSRDDIIYALKQCAKRGHALEPGQLIGELSAGLEAARVEAHEKERMGDARQSYEPTAKPTGERKRKASAAAAASESQRQAHMASNRSSSTVQQLHHAAVAQQVAAAAAAADGRGSGLQPLLSGHLPAYSQQHLPPLRGPALAGASQDLAGIGSLHLTQQLSTADISGLAALAAGLLGGGRPAAPAAPAPELDAARVLNRMASFQGAGAGGNGRSMQLPTGAGASGVLPAPAGAGGPAAGAPLQQMLLLQLLQQQISGESGSAAAAAAAAGSGPPSVMIKSEPVVGAVGASVEGIDFLLECLRLGMNTSPELSCAHDLVRIWACLAQGKAWASEQYNLPQWYYLGLVPHLQACSSASALLGYCGHLWQLGALRVMLAALAGNMPHATVVGLLQTVAAAAGAAPPSTAPSEPAGLEASLHQQASALLTSALQQAQREQEQQAQVAKAVSVLLGGAPAPAQQGGDVLGAMQQLLGGILGGGARTAGAGAGASAFAPLQRQADAPQPQLAQLMQLLGGVAGGGAATAAGGTAAVAAAAAGRVGDAIRTGAAPSSRNHSPSLPNKAARAPSGSSPSTRTESASLQDAGGRQEAASQPPAVTAANGQQQQQQHGGGAGSGEAGAGQELAAAASGEPSVGMAGKSVQLSVAEAAADEAKAPPTGAPAKRARTGQQGASAQGQAEAAAGGSGCAVAVAQLQKQPLAAHELSLEGAGPSVPSVKVSPFYSDPRRTNGAPALHVAGAHLPAAAVRARNGGNAQEQQAEGAAAPAPLPRRPQAVKPNAAASADLAGAAGAGAMTNGMAGCIAPHALSGPAGADAVAPPGAGTSKLDMLSCAASMEAALGKQPNSAFSRFTQQLKEQQQQNQQVLQEPQKK